MRDLAWVAGSAWASVDTIGRARCRTGVCDLARPTQLPDAPTTDTDDARRVDAVLDRLLPKVDPASGAQATLAGAMRYAVLGGGKRLRPRLVYAAGHLSGAEIVHLDFAAAAVELIHAFSLVHDDLPALDDDALRRGRPALHVQFDEATAILAGDALLALAFEAASDAAIDAAIARRWLRLLARATGAGGMVGGQMLDIAGEGQALSLPQLVQLHRLKTGALIRAAVMLGATAGRLPDTRVAALERFAVAIGQAFQIQDDVLDATAKTAVLGKPAGSDERRGKSTYVDLLGVEAARAEASKQLESALRHLTPFGTSAAPLERLATAMVNREF